ncbi:lytic murein transglycosylase B [Solimicrobium silvestre]|uniref:MltB: lytic murein transglycosylase B n=1 Tax=Solimicrobium silvestre TaxID=2099400 RepID=A0A2S9GXV7_9BURK|nr:lytic murein transglycosylase B [Solimicrobium silvestre]PRC92540.1 MltB: lytic murein transglycosylase B [Solimicrobium silvestre]
MPSTQALPRLAALLITLASLLCSMPVFADDPKTISVNVVDAASIDFNNSKEVNEFIDYMVTRHAFTRAELELVFSKVQFNAQSIQLIKPAPITKPKNWQAYRARFVEPIRIKAGVEFWNKYAEALNRAEKQYGIPAQIIVGIIGVETVFGKNVGKFRVVDVLSTLGFAYPDIANKEARMAYFRGELEQSLLYARESGIDPFSLLGSYAGAIGWPQFMPSSIRQYGVDFDGAGKIDLRNSPEDAIGSVANFLVQHGWETGLPMAFPATITNDRPELMIAKELNATYTLQQLADVAVPTQKNTPTQPLYGLIDLQNGENSTEYWLATHNFFAITKYNRSYFYAMSVIELGKAVCTARNANNPCQ